MVTIYSYVKSFGFYMLISMSVTNLVADTPVFALVYQITFCPLRMPLRNNSQMLL